MEIVADVSRSQSISLTSWPDFPEFSECNDSISPSIIAASRHSCRSLKPLTWSGYWPNISVFSNFFPYQKRDVLRYYSKRLMEICHSGLTSFLENVDIAIDHMHWSHLGWTSAICFMWSWLQKMLKNYSWSSPKGQEAIKTPGQLVWNPGARLHTTPVFYYLCWLLICFWA